MARARLTEGLITLDTVYGEHHQAKQVPGMRYHPRADEHARKPHFVYPLSWASCVALRGVFGPGLEVGTDLVRWARFELGTRITPALALRETLELPPESGNKLARQAKDIRSVDGAELRPYQQVGTAFLAIAQQAILADAMRLGKSMQVLSALRLMGALPALFVVPNSAKHQWLEYVERWWPESRPVIIRGTAAQRRAALAEIAAGTSDVGIIGWEAMRLHTRLEAFGSAVAIARCVDHGGDGSVPENRCEAHARELNEIKFRAVVADEAHRAVHPRTKQTRALWAVGWDAEYRFALTGTPVLDTPEDLWALMHWISPDEATQKTSWIDRYALTGWNGFGLEVTGLRPDTRDELFSYVDPRFLRRTREMVMPWLPEAISVERTVELGTKQRKAYNAMRDQMLAEVENGDLTFVTNALSKLTRLRQFASAYAYIDERGDVKLTTPSCKVEAMLDLAEELAGQPAAVFAESSQLINLTGAALEKAGYAVGYVTGDYSDGERALSIAAFQRGDLQFICCTIGAGGEGITLDRANVVVFLQRSFSLARNNQAQDRIVGQHAGPGLEIIDIVAESTIEARVQQILQDKERIVEEIVRDKATFARLLGDG